MLAKGMYMMSAKRLLAEYLRLRWVLIGAHATDCCSGYCFLYCGLLLVCTFDALSGLYAK